MAWYRIDPRYLRRPDPHGLVLGYVEHGTHDSGQLLLYLNRHHAVVRFELSYERFLSRRELYATWDASSGLKVGEVDAHGRSGTAGAHYPMSPIVRDRRASTADLGSLLGYVTRSAGLLDPHHRQTVVAALRDALHRAAGRIAPTGS